MIMATVAYNQGDAIRISKITRIAREIRTLQDHQKALESEISGLRGDILGLIQPDETVKDKEAGLTVYTTKREKLKILDKQLLESRHDLWDEKTTIVINKDRLIAAAADDAVLAGAYELSEEVTAVVRSNGDS